MQGHEKGAKRAFFGPVLLPAACPLLPERTSGHRRGLAEHTHGHVVYYLVAPAARALHVPHKAHAPQLFRYIVPCVRLRVCGARLPLCVLPELVQPDNVKFLPIRKQRYNAVYLFKPRPRPVVCLHLVPLQLFQYIIFRPVCVAAAGR